MRTWSLSDLLKSLLLESGSSLRSGQMLPLSLASLALEKQVDRKARLLHMVTHWPLACMTFDASATQEAFAAPTPSSLKAETFVVLVPPFLEATPSPEASAPCRLLCCLCSYPCLEHVPPRCEPNWLVPRLILPRPHLGSTNPRVNPQRTRSLKKNPRLQMPHQQRSQKSFASAPPRVASHQLVRLGAHALQRLDPWGP